MPKTKIICTIGPSSERFSVLRKMMLSGMDVARLNCSHGTQDGHLRKIEAIRKLNSKYRRHIRILLDLEGYRIRIGKFEVSQTKELKKGQSVILTNEPVLGSNNLIAFDYREDLRVIKEGILIYIDDGTIVLSVSASSKSRIFAKVIIGGVLKEHKGVNIPAVKLKFKGLTDKDRSDIAFGIRNRVDYIAQSFVRDKADMLRIRRELENTSPKPVLVAKIENREGIKNIDEIIEVSDGIMIARGDMGISIPIFEIPIVQKEIIKKCNRAGKFVITATQMLESMTENFIPTRAEVTDVANAVIDGTDFVMLSAESAAGLYPVESVKMMNQIVKFTENNLPVG